MTVEKSRTGNTFLACWSVDSKTETAIWSLSIFLNGRLPHPIFAVCLNPDSSGHI